jgi:hypothetical protein
MGLPQGCAAKLARAVRLSFEKMTAEKHFPLGQKTLETQIQRRFLEPQ